MTNTMEVVPVASSGQTPIRKMAPYELIVVINPQGNTNIVYVAQSGDASTTPTAGSGSEPVPPGGTPGVYFLDPGNINGLSAIAATGATSVVVKRLPFRDETDFFQAVGGYAQASAILSALWYMLSATAIAPVGAITEARADTLRAKTANGMLDLPPNGTSGVRVGTTNNPSNPASTISGAGNGSVEVTASGLVQLISGTQRVADDNTGFYLQNTTPLIVQAGTSDQRAFIDTVGIVASTPAAGGAIASSMYAFRLPIKNGSVIVAGDIVEWDPNNDNRVVSSAAGSVNPQLGECVTGGTGNAGGTVFARVAWRGVSVTFLADAAGVTAGQYGAQGGTVANRLLSAATITPVSFCRILKTAIGGAAATVSLGLT